MEIKMYRTTIIALVLLISACSPFTPKVRIAPEGNLPETFSLYAPDAAPPDQWWTEFDASDLSVLVQEALSGNFSIREAWARLRQSQSLAYQAGAAAYPDVSLSAENSRTRQRIENDLGSSTQTVKNYSLGLASNYEIDLWGRIRSETEAAVLEENASREDLSSAAMTLAASVAENWLSIISQRMQKKLLDQQLETNKTYLGLVELRFRKGVVSALDVYQQRETVERTRAQIPLVEAREQKLLHALALLLGRPPQSPVSISTEALPAISERPATGLPAELLASRPDIRAAGMRLQAADWQVTAAQANRLPAIRLTGTASMGADSLDLIFDNWLLRLAGNLTAPLFDAGRRAAETDRMKAKADERLWAYRRTVYTAIKEVEDALISEEKQKQHILALKAETDAARHAFDEAVARYRKGLSDYLPVLTQLLSLQSLERDMIQRQAELLVYRINLYRALGGTWTDSLLH